jgi:hypothetical protein
MGLEQRLRNALKVTADEFNRALYQFDPTPDRSNSYPERMVSYYYVRALARALPRANVFLEIPIRGRSNRGWDNHIDALIFNDREVIVAEFKVAWAPEHWESLARDLARLRRASVAEEIRMCFDKAERVAPRPRRPFIFLGADVWRPERAEAWKSGDNAGNWALPTSMLASRRDYVCVYPDKGKDFDGYYLTWALFDFNEMAA